MYKKIVLFLIRFLTRIHENSLESIKNLRKQLFFMDFEEREDDVYIVTFLKSGTTWMQVILHNLLRDGNMDFTHIYDVSPWPSNMAFRNESIETINNLPSPRILKSHDNYAFFSNDMKGKIIYVYRDGKDIALSLFHHNKNYQNQEITFDENFDAFFIDEASELNWFKFTSEWLENKNKLPILFISYEQLTLQFDETINKICNYLNIELTDEILKRTKHHASFEFMKINESKFGEIPPKEEIKIFNQFIRKGQIGEGKSHMSVTQEAKYDLLFSKKIFPFQKRFEN